MAEPGANKKDAGSVKTRVEYWGRPCSMTTHGSAPYERMVDEPLTAPRKEDASPLAGADLSQ
jgi:hypothetical protein